MDSTRNQSAGVLDTDTDTDKDKDEDKDKDKDGERQRKKSDLFVDLTNKVTGRVLGTS